MIPERAKELLSAGITLQMIADKVALQFMRPNQTEWIDLNSNADWHVFHGTFPVRIKPRQPRVIWRLYCTTNATAQDYPTAFDAWNHHVSGINYPPAKFVEEVRER